MNEDGRTIAQLDRDYQLAVKHHDVDTIKRIHADDMILVLGNGRRWRYAFGQASLPLPKEP